MDLCLTSLPVTAGITTQQWMDKQLTYMDSTVSFYSAQYGVLSSDAFKKSGAKVHVAYSNTRDRSFKPTKLNLFKSLLPNKNFKSHALASLNHAQQPSSGNVPALVERHFGSRRSYCLTAYFVFF